MKEGKVGQNTYEFPSLPPPPASVALGFGMTLIIVVNSPSDNVVVISVVILAGTPVIVLPSDVGPGVVVVGVESGFRGTTSETVNVDVESEEVKSPAVFVNVTSMGVPVTEGITVSEVGTVMGTPVLEGSKIRNRSPERYGVNDSRGNNRNDRHRHRSRRCPRRNRKHGSSTRPR